MNDGPYEIQYELTDAQVRRAAWSFWWRRCASLGLIMSGAFLCYALVLSFATDFSPVIPTVFYTAAAYQFLLTLGGFRKFARAMASPRAKMESKVMTVSFSFAGVSVSNELVAVSYKWRVFTGLWRCKDLLLLVSQTGYHAIPRIAVSPDLDDFIARCLRAGRGVWPMCRECGYDLRGQTEPRCPECGTPFDADNLKVKR